MQKSGKPHLARGFTLVEIMVVVAIIAILSAIGYPSYQASVRRSHRADAFATLAQNQAIIERCYAQNMSYANCTALPPQPQASAQGYYSVTSNITATTYQFTATAIGSQAQDTDCAFMSIDQANQKTATTTTCWNH